MHPLLPLLLCLLFGNVVPSEAQAASQRALQQHHSMLARVVAAHWCNELSDSPTPSKHADTTVNEPIATNPGPSLKPSAARSSENPRDGPNAESL